MRIRNAISVPLHREGIKFVAAFLCISLVLSFIWLPLLFPCLVLTTWCYYFFRDPVRSVPQTKGLVLSPCDGVVSLISTVVPPAEFEIGSAPLTRISDFMDVFNCHVNRSPMNGMVKKIIYHKGKFVNASLDKASEHNERNTLIIENDYLKIAVVQIAGLIARRILCEVEENQHLEAGERFGMIRFGSRLDVYLPENIQTRVSPGQTCVAGETALADFAILLPDQATTTSVKKVNSKFI